MREIVGSGHQKSALTSNLVKNWTVSEYFDSFSLIVSITFYLAFSQVSLLNSFVFSHFSIFLLISCWRYRSKLLSSLYYMTTLGRFSMAKVFDGSSVIVPACSSSLEVTETKSSSSSSSSLVPEFLSNCSKEKSAERRWNYLFGDFFSSYYSCLEFESMLILMELCDLLLFFALKSLWPNVSWLFLFKIFACKFTWSNLKVTDFYKVATFWMFISLKGADP